MNDRWGKESYFDYKTSEYQHFLENEGDLPWENCRGIGLSFGYNQVESEEHSLSPQSALQLFLDIVSRGGNFLLNVGPTASGEIPEIQIRVLRGIGDWMKINGAAVYGTRAIREILPSSQPWVRWSQKEDSIFAYVDASGDLTFEAPSNIVDEKSATLIDGRALPIERSGESISIRIPEQQLIGPTTIRFTKKK